MTVVSGSSIQLPQPLAGAPRAGAVTQPLRCLWIEEALADPDLGTGFSEPLTGDHQVDVAIVGGGYTGLWTAIHLKQMDPACRVAVVEAGICGGEASGRNGGLALSWWSKVETLIERVGTPEAARLARLSEHAIDALEEFERREAIDFHFRRGGWLWTATSRVQRGAWMGAVRNSRALGADAFEELPADLVRKRLGSPVHLGGVLEARAATVQPARLARALRLVALRNGVDIYENSRAIRPGADGVVATPGGELRAECIVLACNAWLSARRSLRRAVLPLSSDVIATEPIPDLLERHGWVGGESLSDSRLMVHYTRTTRDGRVVFGRGGGSLAFAGRMRATFDFEAHRSEEIEADLGALVPFAAGARITHRWAGSVDRSSDGLPFLGELGGPARVLYGAGFSGNGVAPTWIAGRELALRALGRRDPESAHSLFSGVPGRFPPEPARTLGGIVVRSAVKRKEIREDSDLPVGWITKSVAKLAPSGFFKLSEEEHE